MPTGLTLGARLRFRYWRFIDQRLKPLRPRGANPYLTHLPVLLALRFLRPVRRVLELGAGRFSTLAFLDRQCFPELERIVSVENDPRWVEQIRVLAGGDPRLELRAVSGTVSKAAAQEALAEYDTIFVDDSRSVADRTETIATIARKRPERPVVVIHDFEILEYRYAALPFSHCVRFRGLSPNVGVVWNGAGLPTRPLRRLDVRLRELPLPALAPDHPGWLAWVKGQLEHL
jgi:hypothetical protein